MSEKWLILFLRLVGSGTLLAFGAAVMPEKWIVEIATELGFEPFPYSPLTFYLARNLSLLYGFAGCIFILIASDIVRYRPLVRKIGIAAVAFGILRFAADAQSGMPWWWTLGEAPSTILGGGIILFLDRHCANRIPSGNASPKTVASSSPLSDPPSVTSAR